MNTLKRLSWNHSSDHLQLPPGARSPQALAHTPPLAAPGAASSSPTASYPFPPASEARPGIERTTLHRSLDALTQLLVALDEHREQAQAQARCQQKLVKAQRELQKCFTAKYEPGAQSSIIASALQASANAFDALYDVDSKHAKLLQKEYDACNEVAAKFFKKISKEEGNFEDKLANLDAKMQRANLSYERSRPKSARPSLAESQQAAQQHDRYIASLSTLSNQTALVKQEHAQSIAEKREMAVKEVARVMCGLTEAAWKNRVDGTKRAGEKIGAVVLAGSFCDGGMTGMLAAPLVDEEPSTSARQTPWEATPVKQTIVTGSLRGPRPQPGSEYEQSRPSQELPAQGHDAPVQSSSVPPRQSYQDVSATYQQPKTVNAPPSVDFDSASFIRPALASRHLSQQTDLTAQRHHLHSDQLSLATSSSSRSLDQSVATSTSQSASTRRPSHEYDAAATQELREMTRAAAERDERELALRDGTIKRPQPRYSASPQQLQQYQHASQSQQQPPLERTDTTASERSFVAKMRERYVEEKRQRQAEGEEQHRQQRQQQQTESYNPPTRSASRVSTLAKRFSAPPSSNEVLQDITNTVPLQSITTPRPPPSHRHTSSFSLQSLTRQSTFYDSALGCPAVDSGEFGLPLAPVRPAPWSSASTGPASRPPSSARSYTVQTLPTTGNGLE